MKKLDDRPTDQNVPHTDTEQSQQKYASNSGSSSHPSQANVNPPGCSMDPPEDPDVPTSSRDPPEDPDPPSFPLEDCSERSGGSNHLERFYSIGVSEEETSLAELKFDGKVGSSQTSPNGDSRVSRQNMKLGPKSLEFCDTEDELDAGRDGLRTSDLDLIFPLVSGPENTANSSPKIPFRCLRRSSSTSEISSR